jgi:hypothetical protein
MTITPDDRCPTAEQIPETDANRPQETVWEMGSAYGFNIQVKPSLRFDCSNNDISDAQNVTVRFPEYAYNTYWSVLERTAGGAFPIFQFPINQFSQYDKRVHFTPLWYPDGVYETVAQIVDCWTPAGMLRLNASQRMYITGNVYDDWRVKPGR